jgi:hypothetical protein
MRASWFFVFPQRPGERVIDLDALHQDLQRGEARAEHGLLGPVAQVGLAGLGAARLLQGRHGLREGHGLGGGLGGSLGGSLLGGACGGHVESLTCVVRSWNPRSAPREGPRERAGPCKPLPPRGVWETACSSAPARSPVGEARAFSARGGHQRTFARAHSERPRGSALSRERKPAARKMSDDTSRHAASASNPRNQRRRPPFRPPLHLR